MVWQPEIDDIKHRHQLAEQMGGEEGIERQRKRGKLTVRERIAILTDPGSFQEIGGLAGGATYKDDKLVAFTPANLLFGLCSVNGRKVVLHAEDFTVRGGSHGEARVSKNITYPLDLALDYRLPLIRVLDSGGASVKSYEQIGHTFYARNYPAHGIEKLLCTAPVISLVMGSAAGGAAVDTCLSHFSVMVKGIAQVFPGGPPVVKAALGYEITREELGDERTQVYQGGVVDNLADTEEEAFEMARKFLSYLPQNVWEMPPRTEPGEDPNRRDEELLSIIPREKRRGYNPYAILKHVLDYDSLFEITPFYGRSRITGLARVNGYTVGVMINNPMFLGGSMDVAAGTKVIRFLQLCDTFHLPMVYFADEPGFMPGIEAQKQGIARAGAKMVCATCQTKMPWFVFIIRQAYGVAGTLADRPGGMLKRVAWPSAHWGGMHIEGGTTAAYRAEINAAPDPEAKREEIERRLNAITSPFRSAEVFNIEDIIDPRDSRPLLCDFIEMAQGMIKTQLGPGIGPSYQP